MISAEDRKRLRHYRDVFGEMTSEQAFQKAVELEPSMEPPADINETTATDTNWRFYLDYAAVLEIWEKDVARI